MEFESLIKGAIFVILGSVVALLAMAQSPEQSAYAGEAVSQAFNLEAAQVAASSVNLDDFVLYNKRSKNIEAQDWGTKNFIGPVKSLLKGVTLGQQYVMNNFAIYGTPSTRKLLPDQRWQKVLEYYRHQHSWPITVDDWQALLSGHRPNSY
ncbi:MAG: hypothetical protein WCO55_04790 [Candidatus Falkowbacteria bacterium]